MNSWIMITGAAGGLGKAFAVECASRGWDCFLTDLHEEPLALLAASLRRTYGVQVEILTCDLTDPASRTLLLEAIHTRRMRFWGLVNVAGIDYEGMFYEQTRQQIRAILRLNIEGTLEMTHGLTDFRDPLKTFRIINVASLAAFYPMPVKATYAASKRFLLDFSLALHEELSGEDATVTVLCPAGMPTNRECMEAIEAQGLLGQITTQDIGAVASGTLDCALRGQVIYIPGLINRCMKFFGGWIPAPLVSSLIGARWKAARQKRALSPDNLLNAHA